MWVTVALMANHALIRLKRFVRRVHPNCAISFVIYLHLILHSYVQKNLAKNFGTLNTYVHYDQTSLTTRTSPEIAVNQLWLQLVTR